MFHHCLGALKLKFQFTKFQLLSLETETLNDDPVFPFNSFKAKVPECCCELCTGVLDPMHIATSARPDLLHCDCCLAASQIASHQVAYGNTRQNKIQKSSLGCLCLCIRHVKTSFPLKTEFSRLVMFDCRRVVSTPPRTWSWRLDDGARRAQKASKGVAGC